MGAGRVEQFGLLCQVNLRHCCDLPIQNAIGAVSHAIVVYHEGGGHEELYLPFYEVLPIRVPEDEKDNKRESNDLWLPPP